MGEKTNTVIQGVIIVTLLFGLVAAFVIAYLIYFKKRRSQLLEESNSMKEEFHQQLLQSQIEVQEQTFQLIGKELHDNVGQLLSSSRMLLGLIERSMESPPDTLLTANATIAQAIAELRSLSKSLDKEWLAQFNFSENLQNEIARINAGDKVKVQYTQQDPVVLEPDEQIILFRIVQEAIQNAIKHAAPAQIDIAVAHLKDHFFVSITDNGSGFGINDTGSGLGLNNMKHRTALLGGTITWNQLPQGGTKVSISLPIKKTET